MKIGKKKVTDSIASVLGATRPAKNQSKKNMYVLGVLGVTILLIIWVFTLGRKAERTVSVVMLVDNVYKNELIVESMLQKYDMLEGEFEKYALEEEDGTTSRRIVLWDERDLILNSYAAYPLQKETVLQYRSFIMTRVDNSDNVLYSFPGKDIVPLEIGSEELQAFKAFLEPGDRLNINAIYSQNETVVTSDGLGGESRAQMEVFKTESVFKDIMIADLLNSSGESILDIYAAYRDASTYQQAQLDVSETFKESTDPQTLLVALTPEEQERYYYYLSKSQVEFRVSMPQRVE